jgi:hypothetical protein
VTARKEEPYLVQRLPLPGDRRRRRRQQRQPPTPERPREHGGRSCANEAAAVVTVGQVVEAAFLNLWRSVK